MQTTNYKQELKQFYSSKIGVPSLVQVPVLKYLMVDGLGDPNTSQEYTDSIDALYPVAYAIRSISKEKGIEDFSVMPLEGLRWSEHSAHSEPALKDYWHWTSMVMQPTIVTEQMFHAALDQVAEKKKPRALSKVHFMSYAEGRAAQVMYVGPYAEEGDAIKALDAFIKASGGVLGAPNKHRHEIYLSDPRRMDALKLKTIIRQPF